MRLARLMAGALALAATLVASACGEDERRLPRLPTLDVTLRDFDLRPQRLSVERPGPVLFRVRNEGLTQHALAVGSPARDKTEPIPPGGGATLHVRLPKAGEYVVYCPLADHRARGMRGVVRVGQN